MGIVSRGVKLKPKLERAALGAQAEEAGYIKVASGVGTFSHCFFLLGIHIPHVEVMLYGFFFFLGDRT